MVIRGSGCRGLALGSASGAYLTAKLATQDWARAWVYRFLVLVVILAILHLIMVHDPKCLQHT